MPAQYEENDIYIMICKRKRSCELTNIYKNNFQSKNDQLKTSPRTPLSDRAVTFETGDILPKELKLVGLPSSKVVVQHL